MIIGIDASNLRSGGAITHLSELLKAAAPEKDHFAKVIVWGEKKLLNNLPNNLWLIKIHEPLLDKSLLHRLYWQIRFSSKNAKAANCNVLFVPSGIVFGGFTPVVTMSHNLLPFEWREIRRYGLSWQLIRNLLLRKLQSHSFKNASGMIFLSQYAQKIILNIIHQVSKQKVIIPHGVNKSFFSVPRVQKKIEDYSFENPFRIIYVSTVDMYKHQWSVAEAVIRLRSMGIPVALELIGGAYPPALKKLKQVIQGRKEVDYIGEIAYSELSKHYALSDLCVFASTCENMPNVLLEAMASGLPIACSNFGPMPEVLGESGEYFNPEDVSEVVKVLQKLIANPVLRTQKATASFNKAQSYSWEQCADDTFKFLVDIGKK